MERQITMLAGMKLHHKDKSPPPNDLCNECISNRNKNQQELKNDPKIH